ncbi:MAG: Ig-like domain-containing protein [Muribaculaceae bacterium]|nr:Ig-like domain-containing protein [Muribaculaceae bacterium]
MKKKFLLLLVAALPMVFASCGDDNEEPIDPVNISLGVSAFDVNYNADYQLECNIDGATFTSSDPFVATVDQSGKVTGKHVGQAKIKASYDGYSVQATVNVLPTNTDFEMPILSWGASMNRIKSLVEANPDMQPAEVNDDNALGYTTNGLLPGYSYNFVSDKLTAATMTVTSKQDEDGNLYGYLLQYYKEYGEDSDTGAIYLCDAESVTNASVVLEYGIDITPTTDWNDPNYLVIWRENSSTKTRATGAPERTDFDAFRAAAREVAASCK